MFSQSPFPVSKMKMPFGVTFLILLAILSLAISGCDILGDGGNNGGDHHDPAPPTGWAWISGSDIGNQCGVYGTKEIPDNDNVPGARYGAVDWTDSSENLWLFGGRGYDSEFEGLLNDLWRYDGTNWTWVSGSNIYYQYGIYDSADDSLNVPGARLGSVSWIDSQGNLWLFGGRGCEKDQTNPSHCLNSLLNDLWKFDGSKWTWVSGSQTANVEGVYGTMGETSPDTFPGAREYAIGWIDGSDNLWLFGGVTDCNGSSCHPDYTLNDLWKYDGSNWTWMSGSNTIAQAGTYGTKAVPDSANIPGARKQSVSWIDIAGNFWLFGGYGVDGEGNMGNLNDLWKYDGSNWTWMSGSNIENQPGNYGSNGDPSADIIPGSRYGSISWIDSEGNFWLFGGYGLDGQGYYGNLNDLWKYDGSYWVWESGSNTRNQVGEYGSKGTASTDSVPGGRTFSVRWIDSNDQLWLFGGNAKDSEGNYIKRNDLWTLIR